MMEVYSHQQRIRLGMLNESVELFEKKLSDAEIDQILKKLHAEDEAELEKMNEEYDDEYSESLTEEEEKIKKASSDTKGKMHEILTGYHLQGGKHMEKHPDKYGDSPEEAHDKLKKTIHPKEYEKINARAKSAAADIKKNVEKDGHKIKHVHWTSQPNDLLRTTGIKGF